MGGTSERRAKSWSGRWTAVLESATSKDKASWILGITRCIIPYVARCTPLLSMERLENNSLISEIASALMADSSRDRRSVVISQGWSE